MWISYSTVANNAGILAEANSEFPVFSLQQTKGRYWTATQYQLKNPWHIVWNGSIYTTLDARGCNSITCYPMFQRPALHKCQTLQQVLLCRFFTEDAITTAARFYENYTMANSINEIEYPFLK